MIYRHTYNPLDSKVLLLNLLVKLNALDNNIYEFRIISGKIYKILRRVPGLHI